MARTASDTKGNILEWMAYIVIICVAIQYFNPKFFKDLAETFLK